MKPGHEDEVRLAERAAQWFGLALEDKSARAPLFAWLGESPRHVEAFLSTLALAQEIAELSPETRARLAQLESDAQAMEPTTTNVVPLSVAGPRQSPTMPLTSHRSRRWMVGGSIAAGVLSFTTIGWLISGTGQQIYTTAVGEQRIMQLQDGSTVYLNTDSRLQVRFTERSRALRLDKGQALFKVEREATRPFVVRSGDIAIQAIGTQFDVSRRAAETHVAVIEGSIQISNSDSSARKVSEKISAGEAVEVVAGGRIARRDHLDAAKVTSWRQRRLVFREETLANIAAEFNRYNASVKIKIIGNIADEEHFSGTFEADAPETLVQALAGDETLSVERAGREIVIRARK